MAGRKQKRSVDYFHSWNPVRVRARWQGTFIDYKYLRHSSTAFINKNDVRLFIFNKFLGSCFSCGSKTNLHIHHIFSVLDAFLTNDEKFILKTLNSEDNLQLLCFQCHIVDGVSV